jgi:hypothetical protein
MVVLSRKQQTLGLQIKISIEAFPNDQIDALK